MMRERIARALALNMGYKRKWSAHGPHVHAYLFRHADAVLEAMREPDEGMMTAACNTPGMKACDSAMQLHQARGYGFDPAAFADGSPIVQAWRAAIDKARERPGEGGE